jgi:hypothetical protein
MPCAIPYYRRVVHSLRSLTSLTGYYKSTTLVAFIFKVWVEQSFKLRRFEFRSSNYFGFQSNFTDKYGWTSTFSSHCRAFIGRFFPRRIASFCCIRRTLGFFVLLIWFLRSRSFNCFCAFEVRSQFQFRIPWILFYEFLFMKLLFTNNSIYWFRWWRCLHSGSESEMTVKVGESSESQIFNCLTNLHQKSNITTTDHCHHNR